MASTTRTQDILKTVVLEEIAEDVLPLHVPLSLLCRAITTASTNALVLGAVLDPRGRKRLRRDNEIAVVRTMDWDFLAQIGMDRSAFEGLCERLAPSLKRRSINPEIKVLTTLWFLNTNESIRHIADRFAMSKASLHYIFQTVCRSINDLKREFIKWPDASKLGGIADDFHKTSGFPGVMGVIDSTDIMILEPKDAEVYMNRKGYYCVVLQAVCDSHLRFLDVYSECPGSTLDAQVLKESPLMEKINDSLPSEFHLLGDSEYPMSTHLLLPFKDNGCLNDTEKKYNKCHAAASAHIRRAFSLLRRKFIRLKFLELRLLHIIPIVIGATCVLHNFLLHNMNIDEVNEKTTDMNENEKAEGDDSEIEYIIEESAEYVIPDDALAKRREIAHSLV